MNPELLGMSNEELIQWACKHGAVDEKELLKAWDDIELFCAQNPIGIGTFMEQLVKLSNIGMRLKNAVHYMKEHTGE